MRRIRSSCRRCAPTRLDHALLPHAIFSSQTSHTPALATCVCSQQGATFQQQQQQLQAQLHQGLAAASQSQAAQQVIVGRLASFLSQTHHWLQLLAGRCASQNVDLPVEVTSALNLLQSVASVTSAFTGGTSGEAPDAASAQHAMAYSDSSSESMRGPPSKVAKVSINGGGQEGMSVQEAMAAAQKLPPAQMQQMAQAIAQQSGGPSAAAAMQAAQRMPGGFSSSADSFAAAVANATKLLPAANEASAAQRAAAQGASGVASAMEPAAGLELLAAATGSGNGESQAGAQNAAEQPADAESARKAAAAAMLGASGPGAHPRGLDAPAAGGECDLPFPGMSPAFGLATPVLGNATFSPSAFCSLLNSPDLHQLMSPDMNNGPQAGGQRAPFGGAVASASASNAQSVFAQFKRRQGSSLAPNMAV